MPDAPLTAFALNCSLRGTGSDQPSSTDKMLRDTLEALEPHAVSGEIVCAADHNIKHGVHPDMGEGDAWPDLRRRILAADIFILGTPIWLGQPSSIAKKVLERLDAFLGETDDRNRMPATGKVALVAAVGNEDGAHFCPAACFQALNDVGFTVPANPGIYWVGEAMHPTNYVDLDSVPEPISSAIRMAVSNAAHLARLLKQQTYPGSEG